jgi:hypothetical protein
MVWVCRVAASTHAHPSYSSYYSYCSYYTYPAIHVVAQFFAPSLRQHPESFLGISIPQPPQKNFVSFASYVPYVSKSLNCYFAFHACLLYLSTHLPIIFAH